MIFKLGDFIEQVTEENSDLNYGLNDIVGVTIEKKLIPTVANLKETSLDNFIIVRPGSFIYNPRTHGKKIGLGYNNTSNVYISTWNNYTFKIKDDKIKELLPDYLFYYFNRDEWDKEACFHAWGSSTIVLSWDNFCDMRINVPPIAEQEKIIKYISVIKNRLNKLYDIEQNALLLIKTYLTDKLKNVTELISISDYCEKIQSGATPSRFIESYWQNPTIPWVKNGEVKNNIILNTEESISEVGLKNSSTKMISKGSVLLAMYCVSTPQLAILNIDATTNQAVCCMTTSSEFKSLYLYYYLMFFGQKLTDVANGSAQQNLNGDQIKNYRIKIPRGCDENFIVQFHKIRLLIAQERDCLIRFQKLIISQIFG